MNDARWLRLGMIAATFAFAIPFAIVIAHRNTIGEGFEHPLALLLTTTLIAAFMAMQFKGIVALVRREPGAAVMGRRLAAVHGWTALAILGGSAFVPALGDSYVGLAWLWAWLAPSAQQQQMLVPNFSPSWPTLNLLPVLLLCQWAFLSRADLGRPTEATWRGTAIACIGYCAVLGLWTFSPMFGGWAFFSSPMSTFFNLGVALHLTAVWVLVKRSRIDWLLAGIVGFGCLISGFVLTNLPPMSGGLTLNTPKGGNIDDIGFILTAGWYWLAPYLPPFAYALTALSSVMLFRAHQAKRPASEQA